MEPKYTAEYRTRGNLIPKESTDTSLIKKNHAQPVKSPTHMSIRPPKQDYLIKQNYIRSFGHWATVHREIRL